MKEDDFSYAEDGYTFVVENDLVDEFGTFAVRFYEQGGQRGIFIEPDIPIQSGCASCSSGCN